MKYYVPVISHGILDDLFAQALDEQRGAMQKAFLLPKRVLIAEAGAEATRSQVAAARPAPGRGQERPSARVRSAH